MLPLDRRTFDTCNSMVRARRQSFFRVGGNLIRHCRSLTLIRVLRRSHALVDVGHTRPTGLPLAVCRLRHRPLNARTFVPVGNRIFIIIITLNSSGPSLSALQTFVAGNRRKIGCRHGI